MRTKLKIAYCSVTVASKFKTIYYRPTLSASYPQGKTLSTKLWPLDKLLKLSICAKFNDVEGGGWTQRLSDNAGVFCLCQLPPSSSCL